MSISAVNGVSHARRLNDDVPAPSKSMASVKPFSQQLDEQTASAKGHHHHGATSQPATSSAATAASASGVASTGGIASALLHLIS